MAFNYYKFIVQLAQLIAYHGSSIEVGWKSKAWNLLTSRQLTKMYGQPALFLDIKAPEPPSSHRTMEKLKPEQL